MKEQNYLDHLVGVFGHPVAENPGVVIQDAAFKALGLERWRYLTIDVEKDQVFVKGQEVEFTQLEYKILYMLMQNAGQTLTREQILERIWDLAGNFVEDNTLTVYIKRLRDKIEKDPSNPQIIKTVRGMGYIVEK